ncbi:hypothetical protein V8C35DRAFT_329660 [Trichoderma chlorosporum]
MESTSASPTTLGGMELEPRRRTDHLRRSCEACRSSKVPFIPNADSINAVPLCERRLTNGTTCIFERAIARPRRSKLKPRKAVEEKINGLATLISSISERAASRGVQYSTNEDSTMNNTSISTPTYTFLWLSPLEDVITKKFLAVDEAKQLLLDFSAVSAEFPIVPLPFEGSLDLLTVCATDHLQTRLEMEFRKMLAERVIIKVEKDLDLLQGLLVFLTWNHLYFDPAKEQMYQLSQMATTMAVQLKLGAPDDSMKDILIQRRETFDDNEQYYSIIEKMRTFLACYYVDSCISLAMRKPTHFKYCGKVAECCVLLPYVSSNASDKVLSTFLQLQGLAEDIDQLFQFNNIHRMEVVDYMHINTMTNNFKGKLELLRKNFPPEAKVNSLVQRKFHYIQIYIQEVGLHCPSNHEIINDFSHALCCNWCSSLSRFNIAISCVRAAQTYINEYVLLPSQSLRFTVLFQESELLYAIIVLAVATLGSITVCDPNQLRELADISSHLTALRDKMMTMGTVTINEQDRRDYFWKMMQFFKHCLNWNSQYSGSQAHCLGPCSSSKDNDMSFLRILENIPTDEVFQDNSAFDISDMSWLMNLSEF